MIENERTNGFGGYNGEGDGIRRISIEEEGSKLNSTYKRYSNTR